MPHITELCGAMLNYDQRPKSQQGIHKPEVVHYIFDFWTLVFIRLGRRSVR